MTGTHNETQRSMDWLSFNSSFSLEVVLEKRTLSVVLTAHKEAAACFTAVLYTAPVNLNGNYRMTHHVCCIDVTFSEYALQLCTECGLYDH